MTVASEVGTTRYRFSMPTKLQLERWGSVIFGFLAVAAWWVADGQIKSHFAKEILAALISAAAIAAGFLATSLSILLPIASTETGKRLRSSGYLPYLFRYLREAIYGCLTLALACVLTFFCLPEVGAAPTWLAVIIVFMSAYAAGALARIAEVLMNLFERSSEPEDKDG